MRLANAVFFVLWLLLAIAVADEVREDYVVVVDAGSTGTRCFIFHVTVDALAGRNLSSHPCGKLLFGLSSYSSHPDQAHHLVAPLLKLAASRIPAQYHNQTTVFIKGTAGMRLLPDDRQDNLWTQLVNGLTKTSDVPFHIDRRNVGTIDGRSEAFFAVLASNYIVGSIDGNLHPIPGKPLIGALDMGGSSTQLIFYNGSTDGGKVRADDFWSHSWLNYGVVRVRDRVLGYLHARYLASLADASADRLSEDAMATAEKSAASGDPLSLSEPSVIDNPCGFVGHFIKWNTGTMPAIHFRGTGKALQCIEIIENVIWPLSTANDRIGRESMRNSKPIDEIDHPDVRGYRFYAMSVYYFALDCMRELGPSSLDHWPAPTLHEIEEAAVSFCSMDWGQLKADFHGANQHAWTTPEQLQDRCFEVLYIITLLEKGFGFHRFERNITFALEVGGKEVEWTLGFALAEVHFSPEALIQEELQAVKALQAKESGLLSIANRVRDLIRYFALTAKEMAGQLIWHSTRCVLQTWRWLGA